MDVYFVNFVVSAKQSNSTPKSSPEKIKNSKIVALDCNFFVKLIKAKTNSQLSLKSEKMENIPTELPSCKSLQKQKKFSRYFKRKSNIKKNKGTKPG